MDRFRRDASNHFFYAVGFPSVNKSEVGTCRWAQNTNGLGGILQGRLRGLTYKPRSVLWSSVVYRKSLLPTYQPDG